MEQEKINMFIMNASNKFEAYQIGMIKEKLEQATPEQFQLVLSTEYKDPTTLLIISILIGSLGIDRFMLEDTGLGVAKLLTCGGGGIWTIIDWFTVQKRTKEYNFNKLMKALGGAY